MKSLAAIGILVVLASAALTPRPVSGQTSLQVPIGARGIAMGGAFCALADDATAPFWNPAGLPWIGHQEIAATHADLFGAGIKDDYASFVLPLSRNQAAAVDFYHSGFRDSELDFGESRIDLAYGYRVASPVSVGATIKYLGRHTNLDDVTVRAGSGVGFDFGVLFRPIESVRFAVVAQDAFNTRVTYTQGDGTAVAYPRTLRIGAAYSPIPRGTLALDIDDHWHVGAEYAPIAPVTLRAGMHDDLEGIDGRTLSFGAGLRWSALGFDYAVEDHATLGTTSHFGLSLGFSFNPSQIRIERVAVNDVFTSLYKTYATNPFGSIRLKNLENQPITARVHVLVPELMREPSEQEIVVRPRATQDVPLTAVLPDRVLARPGDRPIQVQVSATYQSLRLPRTEKASARCIAYGPGAIDWSQGAEQAAAFITSRDPVIESVARDAVRAVASTPASTGIRNLDFAAALFDAVEVLGVRYVPDPTNPYSTISGTPKAVDTIFYPRETLGRHAGDCDDTSVLFAALLGNVGIHTKLVDVPGHIFLMAGTDVHPRNQLALGLDPGMFVVDQDEVWIPLETTALGKGFAAAWRGGAEAYASWAERGRVQLVDVASAQSRYEPGELPGAASPPVIDAPRLEAQVGEDLHAIAAWRADYLATHFADVRDSLGASPDALNEVARVNFAAGHLTEAGSALEQALVREPGSSRTLNNLGVVQAASGDLDRASERFRAAAAAGPEDPGIWLNLGLVRYAAGDTVDAGAALDRGISLSGGYEKACALLGIAPDGATGAREGSSRMTVEEARELLKKALRRVPRPAPSAPATTPRVVKPRPWASRIAGGRSAERAELVDLLYWKP